MVVVSFYSSSLTPRTTLLSLVPSPPSCDTTVFSFWHCLYFTFCQAAVRLPIRPFVRPLLFCFERWVEGTASSKGSIKRPRSCARIVACSLTFRLVAHDLSFVLSHPWNGFSFGYCIGTLHFLHGTGSFGEFCLSKQLPGPSLFVVPFSLWDNGNTSMLLRAFTWYSPTSSPLCVLFPSKCVCDLTLPIN